MESTVWLARMTFFFTLAIGHLAIRNTIASFDIVSAAKTFI
jgi:hypothetical protein